MTRASLAGLCAVLLSGAHTGTIAAHPAHPPNQAPQGGPPPTGPSPPPALASAPNQPRSEHASHEHGSQGQGPPWRDAGAGQRNDGGNGNSQHVQSADQQGSSTGGSQENSQADAAHEGGGQGRGVHEDHGHGQAAHENGGQQANSQGEAAHGNSQPVQSADQQGSSIGDSQNGNLPAEAAHGRAHSGPDSQGESAHEHGKSSDGRASSATPQVAPVPATLPLKSSSPASTPTTSPITPSAPVTAASPVATAHHHSARRHRDARVHARGHRNAFPHNRTRTSTSRITGSVLAAPIALARAAHRPVASTDPDPRPRRSTSKTSNPLSGIGGDIPLPLPVPDWSKPIILLLLLLSGWLGVRSLLVARRARRLEGQRAELQRGLDVMQAALVPAVPQRLGDLAVSVAYRPASGPAAGGDFYDLFMLASGKVAIVLGDVAGHGEGALTHAALTRYTLRAYLQAGLQPRAALALAGRVLADPEGERFATVAVGVFAARSGKLTYALAGHHPPLVSAAHVREPIASCVSPPVGWGAPTGRRQTVISLPAGSQVCFFSDGLIEARYEGGLLGRERLGEMLASLGSRPQATELLERVRTEAEASADDMVACVLIPQTPTLGEPTHTEELLVDPRLLAGSEVRRFLRECRLSADEIKRTIENARAVAGTSGEALLRIQLASHISTVSVLPAPTAQSTAQRTQPQASEGLLQTLPAG